ncbi:hypothetical protein DRO42_01255 [Candidatus Bathyarchaeota archaeon]|nr:MAG: hypothetical protein DRO42_01255 [Candidatus Bathyarchaeota archaeon]
MNAESMELEVQLIERTVDKRNALLARAEEQAKKILKAAEQECERIRSESERQILTLAGSELRAARDRIIGRAELEGRKLLMLARDELLSSVFSAVKAKLKEMVEGGIEAVDYGEILLKLTVEAITEMGGEEFIVAANERDLKYLKKNLKKIKDRVKTVLGDVNLRLDDNPIDALGGVIVRNSEGTKIYYNTLEGRLRTVRSRIEAEVAKTLGVI